MNGLRRGLLAGYSVVFIALCLGLIALAWNQDQQLDINPDGFRFVSYISSGDTEKLAFSALMACLALFGVLTLVVAIAVGDTRGGAIRARRANGTSVELDTDAVEAMLRAELQGIPEIRHVEPRVRTAGAGVDVDVAASIEPSASIAHVTDLVLRTTTAVLRDELGIGNLRRPHVRLRYDEMAARPVGSGRMSPQAGMAGRDVVEEDWPPPPPDLYPRPAPPVRDEGDAWPAPPPGLQFERPAQGPMTPPPPVAEAEAWAARPDPAPPAPPAAGPRWDGPEPEAGAGEAEVRRE
ncbi:MAG: hypothetical protein IT303_08155 [Dehalococcoidia bacterium]|nr:hypothetical protein [Dehalococcoidia bacterium]